ncbi:MAG: ribosome silencing factor [Proteobacteria bacterium]|nr:ribosome silencing factor [Pseudomonadota bacterium]
MLESKDKALGLAKIIDSKGALNISVIYIGELSSVADYIVLASGASERQVRATAEFVVDEYKKADIRPLGVEGIGTNRWVLVDYGDVVLHVFLEELRGYYDMDGLWADAKRIETNFGPPEKKEVEPT